MLKERKRERLARPRSVVTGIRNRWVGALCCASLLAVATSCSSSTNSSSSGDNGLFMSPDEGGNFPPAPGGAVLAEVELEAPTQTPFVLRGTIPLPPNSYPRTDGQTPFAVRNSDGNVVPTQVEIVSRYANDQAGADVVEVLARVDLPPGTPPGTRVRYQVVDYVHPRSPLPVPSEMVKFLMTPGNVLLVAEDVFGNRYELDLLSKVRGYAANPSSKLLRKGAAAVQVRTYGSMLPKSKLIGAPSGALPHFLGAHAYTTVWADTRAISLDLRIHNGFDGGNKQDVADDPLGKVYLRWLEVWVPVGWTAVQDVEDIAAAPAYRDGNWMRLPLIEPRTDGKMHVVPHQAQFNRRLGLAKANDTGLALHLAYDEGLGFCRRGYAPDGAELWSWWNRETARYFNQRHVLPDLTPFGVTKMTNELAGTYWMARTALETGKPGNWAVPSGALGWAHPWGVAYGGMTGGVEINLYDGLQLAEVGTNKGWKSVQWAHRMNADRQAFVLFDQYGEPSSVEKWVQYGSFPFIEMNFWGTLLNGPDPFGFGNAQKFQVQYVANQGLQPGYEAPLAEYMPHDFQHYVRYTRSPKVLAWLGNDALAKDDLRQAAEIARLSMHEYPNSSGKWHSGAALWSLQGLVNKNPSKGLPWGRGESWSVDVVTAAYTTGDDEYRERVLPWLRDCADIVAQGQVACSGFIMAVDNPQWSNEVRMRTQPEHTIIENALWGLTETVFRGADKGRFDQMRAVLAEATHTVIGPIAWSEAMHAPWYLAATAPLDLSQASFCQTAPAPPSSLNSGADGFFSWASFGYGYELTGNEEFLQKATAMSGGGNLLSNLIYRINKGNANVETCAALLALLQS
jgi:hypothetical protein